MPRSLKTKMAFRRERILSQIAFLKSCLLERETELQELDEVIRVKGPFATESLNRIYLQEIENGEFEFNGG